MDESKGYLISNRLAGLMNELKIDRLTQLVRMAEDPKGLALRDRIVDALTTHETLFFRDQSPFDALTKHIIPQVRDAAGAARPRLRIWSAACSTGQEPYSIAIQLLESLPDIDRWSISILATDVAAATVEKARRGAYGDHEVRRGISPALESKYFVASGAERCLIPKVRQMVTFQVGNLSGPSQPIGPFDLIFCRNVLIYFKPEDAKNILRKVASRLADGGRLFVGCSEVLSGVSDFLVSENLGSATCYRHAATRKPNAI